MRLFVAVNLPPRLCRDLATRLDATRGRVRIAWTRAEAWHLTLTFLGEWPPDRLPALSTALQEAVAGLGPLTIQPGKVGAFPTLRRPRVLFLHLDGGEPLVTLATWVRQAVDRTWPDGPQDRKDFRPHLTLARIKRPLTGAEATLLRTLDLGGLPAFTVDRVALMASELHREGARYASQADVPLGG
jgi:2'-5' RNA ligase